MSISGLDLSPFQPTNQSFVRAAWQINEFCKYNGTTASLPLCDQAANLRNYVMLGRPDKAILHVNH
jgi:hypothetical protein